MSVSKQGAAPVQVDVDAIRDALLADGWQQRRVGIYRSCGDIKDHDRDFALFVRERNLNDLIKGKSDHYSKKWSSRGAENADKQAISNAGTNPAIGPNRPENPRLPLLADFSKYVSLNEIRTYRRTILIGFDSEWYGQPRIVLTWQFAVVHGESLIEFVFLRRGSKSLYLELAIGRILDYLELPPVDIRECRRYYVCTGFNDAEKPVTEKYSNPKEALEKAKYIFRNGQFVKELIEDQEDRDCPLYYRDWSEYKQVIEYRNKTSVTLVCHTAKVDLSTLDQSRKGCHQILKYCSEVQGGLVTMYPMILGVKSVNPAYGDNTKVFPISLNIADTMCHAPAESKSLKTLGEAVGVPKIDLPEGCIEHMDSLLEKDPCLYFRYASNDSVVALLYASALYGYNSKMPVTITSATASVMKQTMMAYLGTENTDEFNLTYRGLETVDHGKVKTDGCSDYEEYNKPAFIENSSLEPITDKANTIQTYASKAFHGGYNICSVIGYFNRLMFDYDLQNAYPTSMCLVPDIDWLNPIKYEIKEKDLTLEYWRTGEDTYNPMLPIFIYGTFEFPESTKYTCLPVEVNGIPIMPRTTKGLHGVYLCGPELYLALRLGAKVHCETGYVLNTLTTSEGTTSYSLREAVFQLVKDRKQAKKDHDQGSLEERMLKVMVNSGYGKNAQNVIQKYTWSAYKEEMDELGCSSITNPVSAALITSIVRAVLIAAQNQALQHGYQTVSVTTDGFISDMPEETLKSLDLYGFREQMEKARLFLTEGADPELWEIKHVMDDLVNFCTRGNVSLHDSDDKQNGYTARNPIVFNGEFYPGVCAHNSTKSGFPSDTYEDRLWLMTQVLGRTDRVKYYDKEWTKFKELAQGMPFQVKETVTRVRMDFDMKRRPVKASLVTLHPVVEGTEYEIANFDTVPFESAEEFVVYRRIKENCTVLRTVSDWELFFFKIAADGSGAKPRDMDWARLNTCVMGHIAKHWVIPGLDVGSRQDKCDFINRHNASKKKFTIEDWKAAHKPKRQSTMLPDAMVQELLNELISATDYESPAGDENETNKEE